MSKIGLRVTKISGGVQELLTINGGEWTRKVVDIRTDIKVLTGRSLEEGADVLMLSFIPNGSLLTLFHTITGRSGDLVSAWIFIPNDIDINADDEMYLLMQVKQELSKTQVDSWGQLEGFLSRDYPQKDCFPFVESSQDKPCAVRSYGMGTDYVLKDLLGNRIYQDDYSDHKYIFFLDKKYDIQADDRLVNYTDSPLRERVVIRPPQLPSSVTIKINGKDFNTLQPAFRGQKLNFSLEREGFMSIPFQWEAKESPIPLPPSLPWKVAVSPASFYVTNSEKKDISADCRFQLNGQRLDRMGVTLNEADAMRAHIVISCRGHEDFSSTVNLLAGHLPMPITLKSIKRGVIFLINNVECPNLKECPSLYKVEKEVPRQNTVYKYCVPDAAAGGWKKIAIIAAIVALLLGMAIGGAGYHYWSSRDGEAKVKKPNTSQSKHSSTQNKDTNLPPGKKDAKVYASLSGNMWNKEKMEKEGIGDLFDDMTHVKLDSLTHKWKNKIDPVKNPNWGEFVQKVESLRAQNRSGVENYTNLKNAGYLDAEKGINYKKYLDYLEKDLKTNPSATQNGSTPSNTENATPIPSNVW